MKRTNSLSLALLIVILLPMTALAEEADQQVSTRAKSSVTMPSGVALKAERDLLYKEFIELMKKQPVNIKSVQELQRQLKEIDRLLSNLD